MIHWLGAEPAPLSLAGGKGANLARLVHAGLPVPRGFLITTPAYRLFAQSNNLDDRCLEIARTAPSDDSAALERASGAIRAHFEAGPIPSALADTICAAYVSLGSPPVAVRSSATTEDLPDLSFAGQQDTFLNIVGRESLLQAVVRCWSSLWTARAMAYRTRNGIDHQGTALAVVVQEMVQSEAAGVLFTANPLTGARAETVIDASLGLGEALVSGQVEPDHYTVDPAGARILSATRGTKAVAIRGKPGGGTIAVAEDAADRQALPDQTILDLSALGQRVASLFGVPQDVEWAWADGRLFILQSRPITSLFPVPDGMEPEPLQVLLSLGAVQGMLDPLTPFGRDVFRQGAASIRSFLGTPATPETQRPFAVAAERLFVNVTGVVRHAHGRQVIRRVLTMVEPGTGQALELLLNDPRLAPEKWPIRFRVVTRAVPLFGRIAGNVAFNLLWPDAGRRRIQRRIEAAVESFQARSATATTLGDRVALCEALVASLRRFGPVLMPGLASGLGALRLIHYLVAGLPDADRRVLETTRGLPNNVTTQMDLALWQAAVVMRADPAAAAHLRHASEATLATDLLAGRLPHAAQAASDDFMRRFGMRGVAEIDIGRPRWREDPRLLIQVLRSYLEIDDTDHAPDRVFERGAASARAAIAALVEAVRHTRHGWLTSHVVRWAAHRVRALAGLRESPKFTVVRLLGIWREALLASGRELVAAGVVAQPDDIFFLHMDEARALARGERREWRSVVLDRRAVHDREKRRRQVPRVLLSDGRAFFDGVAETADAAGADMLGTPVSPGVVEGRVHVVFDPHGARIAPGDILVCRGTDPAWTPLFLAAGGLVMEVGGLMTHGSVVAREYGIPAVVGVRHATTRLETGQRARVDGSRGTVTILRAPQHDEASPQ